MIRFQRAARIGVDLKGDILSGDMLAVRLDLHEPVPAVREVVEDQISVRVRGYLAVLRNGTAGSIHQGAVRLFDVLSGNDLEGYIAHGQVLVPEGNAAVAVAGHVGELLAVLVEAGFADLAEGDPLVRVADIVMGTDEVVVAVVQIHAGNEGPTVEIPGVQRVGQRSLLGQRIDIDGYGPGGKGFGGCAVQTNQIQMPLHAEVLALIAVKIGDRDAVCEHCVMDAGRRFPASFAGEGGRDRRDGQLDWLIIDGDEVIHGAVSFDGKAGAAGTGWIVSGTDLDGTCQGDLISVRRRDLVDIQGRTLVIIRVQPCAAGIPIHNAIGAGAGAGGDQGADSRADLKLRALQVFRAVSVCLLDADIEVIRRRGRRGRRSRRGRCSRCHRSICPDITVREGVGAVFSG